ncbi:hypothetical protein KF840_13075 [bacterium]|nr:hypothetical protein [bacterium]
MAGRTYVTPLLLAVIAVVGGSPARGDVDLTGSWRLDTGFDIITVDAVQFGTSLTIWDFSGAIDPVTGTFMLEAPPRPGGALPDGTPYPPSPTGRTMNGTASDSDHLSATVVDWIFKITPPVDVQHFPWFGFVYPVAGTRLTPTLCGDGQLDPDELCDDGIANGVDGCCSSMCTLVDGDGDGICDAADDCPAYYDPAQTCLVAFELSLGRVNAHGRARLHGTLAGIGSVTHVTLTVGATTRTAVLVSCEANSSQTKVRCTNADHSLRLRLQRPAAADDWRLRVTATDLPASATGPLGIEIEDRVNGNVGADQLTNCTRRHSRLRCVP